MKIRELEALRAIFDTGSVSHAARSIGVTQSGVSRMLARIEQEIGFELFYRIGGRLVPTRAALTLRNEVMRTLDSVDNLRRLALAIGEGRTGEVQFGCAQSLVNSLVPRTVKLFSQEWPDTRIVIEPRPSRIIVDMVASRKLELALLFLPVDHPGIAIEPLFWFSSVCVLSVDHPLAGAEVLTPADLARERLILLSHSDPARFATEHAFRQARVVPLTRYETPNVALASHLAEQKCGIAIVNALMARDVASSGTAIVPFSPALKHQIALVRPADFVDSRMRGVRRPVARPTGADPRRLAPPDDHLSWFHSALAYHCRGRRSCVQVPE